MKMGLRPLTALASLAVLLSLGGCTSLLGGGGKNHTSIYAPEVRQIDAQAWPQVSWRLALARTTGARSAESQRILVRPTPNELQVYKGAQWAKSPGDMLEEGVLHALEDSGKIPVVARQSAGVGADYRLILDIRRFESDYGGAAVPSATIEVTAKLLHVKDQQLAGSRTFLQVRPAASTAVPDVVAAFDQALAAVTGELAGWTLATGEQHERTPH
ncbi:ABC-type transport auxiliary lipoprotein family protein [Lysobacter terrae]